MSDLFPSTFGAFQSAANGLAPPPVATPAASPTPPMMSARDTLNQLVQQGLKSGAYDSTADMQKYLSLLDTASKAKTPTELQAEELLQQATALNKTADFEQANPLPSPKLLSDRQGLPYDLPGVPENVQPSPNGIASLGAGIAGLFAPAAAGRFAAEALQGAITATARENDARQQKYRFDLQQSMLKHQEQVRADDARAEVEAANTKAQNVYSIEQHADNLTQAKTRFEAAQIDGTAGVLQKFVEGNRPAEAAKAEAAALNDQIQMQQKNSDNALSTATRAAQLLANLDQQEAIQKQRSQDRADALAERTAKDKADAAAKVREDAIRQQNETRKESHDQAREDIERSGLSLKQQELAIRALNVKYAHEDRMRGQDLHSTEQRGSVMHHETPEEISAKTDMEYLKGLATAARKAVTTSTLSDTGELDRLASRAEERYNRARANYQTIGDKARADDEAKRTKARSGAGTAVLSGPGFSLVPR